MIILAHIKQKPTNSLFTNLICYLIHKFHNLSWITEINELFHDILIYWDAPVYKNIANNRKCTNHNMHCKPVWGDKSSMLFISLFKNNVNVFYTPTALYCISYYLTSYHIFFNIMQPKNGSSVNNLKPLTVYCPMYRMVFLNLHAVTYQQTYLFTAGIIQNSSTLFWT